MKTILDKKLNLSKKTVAHLSQLSMSAINGGDNCTEPYKTCIMACPTETMKCTMDCPATW